MTIAEPPVESAPAAAFRPLTALTGPVLGLAAVLALFIILIGSQGKLGNFLSLRNAQVIAQEATIPAVVALGMLLVIISGGIDLSVGSVVALVSVVMMQVYRQLYRGPESVVTASMAAAAAGVAVGGLCGLVNGLVITRLRLAPFVATLGMFSIARGLAVWLAGRQLLAFRRDTQPAWVGVLQQVHAPAVFNPGFWGFIVLAIITAVLLRRTVFGRYVYAIGSSEPTARLCGVPVNRTKVVIYVFCGLMAGLGGLLLFAHGAAGDPNGGETLELSVIAAVVIGGASLSGGRGTVVGAVLGVLTLGVLSNGVNTYNVPIEVQYILIGVILLANTALSQWRDRAHGVAPGDGRYS
jgi:ribose/xylose/arabinose/galactoside ABC-type transport system permease subunit